MMSDHEVQMVKDNMSEFNVKFHGPKDSEMGRVQSLGFRFRVRDSMSKFIVKFHGPKDSEITKP
jgi:hypothetical protein